MSTPAMAILGFGISFGDTLPAAFASAAKEWGFDFDEFVLEAAGMVDPGYHSPEYAEYSAKRKALLAAHPASFCRYGTEDKPGYALFLNGSVTEAYDNEATGVFLGTVKIVEKGAAFEEFCKSVGISAAPRWLMVARYC